MARDWLVGTEPGGKVLAAYPLKGEALRWAAYQAFGNRWRALTGDLERGRVFGVVGYNGETIGALHVWLENPRKRKKRRKRKARKVRRKRRRKNPPRPSRARPIPKRRRKKKRRKKARRRR